MNSLFVSCCFVFFLFKYSGQFFRPVPKDDQNSNQKSHVNLLLCPAWFFCGNIFLQGECGEKVQHEVILIVDVDLLKKKGKAKRGRLFTYKSSFFETPL